MRISLFLLLVWLSETRSGDFCEDVIHQCKQGRAPWTRCFEDRIVTCRSRSRFSPNFVRRLVNSSQEAEAILPRCRVTVPPSALQRSRGAAPQELVLLVATVLSSTLFEPSPHLERGRGAATQSTHRPAVIMEESVLLVRAGLHPLNNLPQPIRLTFKGDTQAKDGTCVFWQESRLEDGTGRWSADGCATTNTGAAFVCSCNHLSFFAVLVNPSLSVGESDAVGLTYLTYVGSALSVFFALIGLISYACLQRRRPETAISVHMQLTGALLCLHLNFLLSSFWVWVLEEDEEGWVCQTLGLFLHWSLLATFSWTALEGFHLYLLLVKVFNIYIRKYLLKLCIVGWGLPTLTVTVCGILGVYGKYSLELRDGNSHNSTTQMCWMSSRSARRLSVSYASTVAFPCLVLLYNSCMLGLVVLKIWRMRRSCGGTEWKKGNKENSTRLWKDCATVLGLSCVLGLPWGLLSATYMSIFGIYLFTVINSLQGLLLFLWSVALTYRSRSDNNPSVRDTSSQKIMTTSFST
ncbi:adhesion G-protein coupled receptor G1-like [Brachionichthys hirsutus]|uniref:adhesion G-protein coupled receptor G1-like n=1 Tax=Brachionichthys hirsutus TaxID=412623 RepID=UPI003604B64B